MCAVFSFYLVPLRAHTLIRTRDMERDMERDMACSLAPLCKAAKRLNRTRDMACSLAPLCKAAKIEMFFLFFVRVEHPV